MLTDSEIASIVGSEEKSSLGYLGEGSRIQSNRATLLDYYNQVEYGNEIDGTSKVVTSEVHDVVETMLPQLLRIFTQGRNVAKFTANQAEADDEAKAKTEYANWVFNNQNDGVMILHSMFKDALLQYNGNVKVYWDDSETSESENYNGLSELELQKLKQDENYKIKSEESVTEEIQGVDPTTGQPVTVPRTLFNVEGERINKTGKVVIENIPVDELMITKRARDFIDPPFIGQRTPKTRSELIEMGFDPEIVATLGKDDESNNEVSLSRNRDVEYGFNESPSADRSQDIIYLGEYYIKMDVDEDGISELWQVFFSNGKVLEKNRVECHPYCVVVPVPMPHKAIGTCPADEVSDLQLLSSVLTRQALNNIFAANYSRFAFNDRVEDIDALLNPGPGQGVHIKGDRPPSEAITPFITQNQSTEILQMLEYVSVMSQKRTGVTPGQSFMDTEALNKTATAFRGFQENSQMRVEQIARIFADTGVKHIFERIAQLAAQHQSESIQIRVHGQPLDISPAEWRYKTKCRIDVGVGSGDRTEKVANLNYMLEQQKELMQMGSPLADSKTLYNTVSQIVTEVGLKDESLYVNNPEIPMEILFAEFEKAQKENEQLKQQLQQQNIVVEAEKTRAEGQIIKQDLANEQKTNEKLMELRQRERESLRKQQTELTKIEAEQKVNVPGALI